MLFYKGYSFNKFLEFLMRNVSVTNILLPVAYIFNAYAVSSDILRSLKWLGISTKISLLMQSIVIIGWILMYLSSHSDKSYENKKDNIISKETLQKFIKDNLDISYLHISQPNQELEALDANHFKFIFSLTAFHYFKKSFAESIYLAISNKYKFENLQKTLNEIFDPIQQKMTEIKASSLIEECKFYFDKDLDARERSAYLNTIESCIKENIDCLKKTINESEVNCLGDMIKLLDDFSAKKRANIINAINKDEMAEEFFQGRLGISKISLADKKTSLKLLLKIEHTYSLSAQRQASNYIISFSILNAICNGLTMLAGGYANVGLNISYLAIFSLSGLSCSYILTSPKIYKIINNIFGHFENYLKSPTKKIQNPSFVFTISIIIAVITAFSSAIFAFFVLHSFIVTNIPTKFIFGSNCIGAVISGITFCGAFCLYFDSIFTIISNNKKDIFSQEDSFVSIIKSLYESLLKKVGKFNFYVELSIATASSYLLYQIIMVNVTAMNIIFLINISLMSIILFPKQAKEYLPLVTALLIGFAISTSSIHQLGVIFNIPRTPIFTAMFVLIGIVQGFSLSCTFYKGLSRFIAKTEQISKEFKLNFKFDSKRRSDSLVGEKRKEIRVDTPIGFRKKARVGTPSHYHPGTDTY